MNFSFPFPFPFLFLNGSVAVKRFDRAPWSHCNRNPFTRVHHTDGLLAAQEASSVPGTETAKNLPNGSLIELLHKKPSSDSSEEFIPLLETAGTMDYLTPEYDLELCMGRRPVGDDGTVLVDLMWSLREKGKALDGADG
ncbi:L-type lectin-domain containing receptor kinase S.6 [Raphanus sativus]|nr:L-type lectin-domain containing receptor kinase S.6 [Raphanus sativus]